MKPHRICMTHHLVLAYGLHKKMDVFVSPFGLLRLAHQALQLWIATMRGLCLIYPCCCRGRDTPMPLSSRNFTTGITSSTWPL